LRSYEPYLGFNGLAIAKTFLSINPHARIAVLESASTLGGVWAATRLYPGLRTNNQLGTYEYSDFPMDEATFGVKSGSYIPGTVVHSYLQAYALKFGVAEKIWFDSKVTAVERKNDGRWRLTIENGSGNGKGHILTHKLVVATGLTSEPFLPEMKGASTFRAPFFHSKDFWKHADMLKSARDIVIFGGHKSAWDVSYAAAAAGARVTMVIRKSGRGPNWMTHSQKKPHSTRAHEAVHVVQPVHLGRCGRLLSYTKAPPRDSSRAMAGPRVLGAAKMGDHPADGVRQPS
jgi:cation diffusion facilitator CzcD-associated flavoprotein CzcO